MKKIYWTYRPVQYRQPVDINGNTTLNGWYTPSGKLSFQFYDWTQAGLTVIKDSLIPEDKYTGEIVPWVKKLTRFIVGEYNETYVDPVEFGRSMENTGAEFNIDIFDTPELAKEWVRANTSLVEESEGKFLISPAGEFMGVKNDAVYLTIE